MRHHRHGRSRGRRARRTTLRTDSRSRALGEEGATASAIVVQLAIRTRATHLQRSNTSKHPLDTPYSSRPSPCPAVAWMLRRRLRVSKLVATPVAGSIKALTRKQFGEEAEAGRVARHRGAGHRNRHRPAVAVEGSNRPGQEGDLARPVRGRSRTDRSSRPTYPAGGSTAADGLGCNSPGST